ncbi:exodeoxyribonuclease VII small subunit [Phormidium tenue FACHB-886]|nr:exodeoxyribonuclease VII small subunit [Phormidium tenue FACHB-886]
MSDSPDLPELPPIASLENSKLPISSSVLPTDWDYEATVAEIETIINRIEMGELELAEVFNQFSNAVEQLRRCEAFLSRQQHQVDLLIETLLDDPEAF